MKVLFVNDGMQPYYLGGMPKLHLHMPRNLALLGIDVTVMHCVPKTREIVSETELNKNLFPEGESQVKSLCVQFPEMFHFPGHYVLESRKLSKMYFNLISDRLMEFDWIYSKGFTGVHFIKQKLKGVKMPPVVAQLHGLEMFQKNFGFMAKLRAFMLRPLAKYCLVNADFVFAYGGKIKDLHKTLGVSESVILPQYGCVPRESFRDNYTKTSATKNFIYIARNERRKAIPEMKWVFERLKDNTAFHIDVVGPIPIKYRVASSNITYHGEIKDEEIYRNLLRQNDILLMPSITEGFPTVVIEAMAQGCTVLANDVGAVAFVVNKENGWLIPLDFNLFLEKINHLIDISPEQLDKRKENALKMIKNNLFWDIEVKRMLNMVKEKVLNKT